MAEINDGNGEVEVDLKIKAAVEINSIGRVTSAQSEQMIGAVLDVSKTSRELENSIANSPNHLGPDDFIKNVDITNMTRPRQVIIDPESFRVVYQMDQFKCFDYMLSQFSECNLEIASK